MVSSKANFTSCIAMKGIILQYMYRSVISGGLMPRRQKIDGAIGGVR